MAGSLGTLSDATFDEEIGSSSTPVLVDFWAEWCGPCKMIAPILEEIADEKGDAIKILKLNVDDAPEIARRFEVMSIPTMILFKDGEEAKRIIGAKPKQALVDDIAEYL
ncbi:MAG: thioredoxin 1 [Candidatus Aldehydirespiratoraceae bacterium]|jgi:thioredoxin 1